MKRWMQCLWAAGFVVAWASVDAAPPYRGKLGVEAVGDAFVDIVRENYRWETSGPDGAWRGLRPEEADEHGWPERDCRWISDYRPCAEWTGHIDDPDAYRLDRSGTYLGSFRGSARLECAEGPFAISNVVYDAAANQTTFALTIGKPGPQHGLVVLRFIDTRRNPQDEPGTGITEFRLLRPGYPRDSGEVFTREYRNCLGSAAFSTIRFMCALDTNGNVEWDAKGPLTQSWANRKLLADASVSRMETLNKKDGWPWELVIQLCNEMKMDPWINIPVSVDDEYIRQLALLLKSQLDPERAIYIEHSNEIWNFGFIQYAWNKARAVQEVKAGHVRYDYDQVANEELWAQRRHAQRVKDSVDIFASVFGKEEINRRIRGILAGVTADPEGFFICGRLAGMLEYLQATGGDPRNYIYAISVPLYYGGEAAKGEGATVNFSVDQILEDMRQSIDDAMDGRAKVVALARKYQLAGGVCSYEGGQDLGGGRTENVGNRIRAVRDPRQVELYRKNFAEGYWDLGGNLAMQFTLAGVYSRYGAWGLTDDLRDPERSSLFQTVRELIGTGAAPQGQPVPGSPGR